MKILLPVILIALSSCVLTKKQKENFLSKHCVGSDSTVIVEKKETIIKDTTLYVTLDGETMYLENPCKLLCDSLGNLKPFTKQNESGKIKTKIKSVGNSIVFDCKVDSAAIAFKYAQTHYSKETLNNSTKVITVNEKSSFERFTFIWFFITAITIIVLIYFKLKT